MPYIGRSTDGFGVRNRFLFVASANDTSVSGADANGATLTFTDGAYVDVYLNGVLLKAGTDYNTNTANTIAGLSALSANDEVTVIVFDVFTVADMVSATTGGTFSGDIILSSTDAGASSAPNLTFNRNSSSPATDDVMGKISFKGKNDADEEIEYGNIEAVIADETDGTEDGKIQIGIMRNGTVQTRFAMAGNSDTKFFNRNVQLSSVDFKARGNEIFLDSDDDTSITADTDDRIDFKTGGTDRLQIQSTSGNNVVIADGLTLTDGNLILASGHGIDFSAETNSASGSASALLDDYEEGTFTAAFTNFSGSATFSNAVYVKIGQMVFFTLHITGKSNTSDGDQMTVSGFPFAVLGEHPASVGMNDNEFGHAMVNTAEYLYFYNLTGGPFTYDMFPHTSGYARIQGAYRIA